MHLRFKHGDRLNTSTAASHSNQWMRSSHSVSSFCFSDKSDCCFKCRATIRARSQVSCNIGKALGSPCSPFRHDCLGICSHALERVCLTCLYLVIDANKAHEQIT